MNNPEKLKVKFQSGSIGLSYVTYLVKDKIAKEKSWTNWGNGKILDIDNEFIDGFTVTGFDKRSSDWFGSV